MANASPHFSPPRRVNILGIGVDALTLPDAVDRIVARSRAPGAAWVVCRDMHGVMAAHEDPALFPIHADAFLVTPDGMPLVWWLRAAGQPCGRVYGPDLMLALADAGQALGLRHYFYGGEAGVAEALVERLRARFPSLLVAGVHCPPFQPLSDAALQSDAARIAQSSADIVWVGLSTPKQEHRMAALAPLLPRSVLLGVGAAFDFHAGRVRQAPRWVQRSGTEWLFRVGQEPQRLGPRYLKHLPRFLLMAAGAALGWRRYAMGTGAVLRRNG